MVSTRLQPGPCLPVVDSINLHYVISKNVQMEIITYIKIKTLTLTICNNICELYFNTPD